MEQISRKGQVKSALEHSFEAYQTGGVQALCESVHAQLLMAKVRFPLLEYAAREIHQHIQPGHQIPFCDNIANRHTIGGNVLIGIMLQLRLREHFESVFDHVAKYIEIGAEWYVSDIIGERVHGYALLHWPDQSRQQLEILRQHPVNWVRRSIGPGIHYATKKGLDKAHVEPLFALLLKMANSKDYQVKRGIGWAAKTVAKFHPDIIEAYSGELKQTDQVGKWFLTKVRIGLQRNAYAQRN